MITRNSSAAPVLIILALVAAASIGCQKVPLLAPSGSVLTLTTTTTAVPVNGTAQLVAQLLEQGGSPPHSGTQVIFTTTLGSIEPSSVETDINGRAVATFKAGTANGTATITAASGGASASGTNAVKIAVGTAAVGRVSVTASPTVVPALGGTSTISATVFDINGNALTSAPVSFSTTAGTLDTLIVSTDGNGIANTVLRTSSTATVTASVGAQGSTTPSTGTGTTTPAASGQSSGSVTVNVAGAPTLTITPPTTPPSAGASSTFTFAVAAGTTNGSAIRDVTVNWGDGETQDLGALTGSAVVAHTYRSTGTYTIRATVTDSFGNSVPVSITVTVNPRAQPVVSISTTTTNPTAGTDMTFTASVAPATGTPTVISNVVVDWGDNTNTNLGPVTGTTIQLHHVYQVGGTYTVRLTATDNNGGVGTAVTSVFVQTQTPLTVLLSATATPAGANTTETFTATVIGLGNEVVVNYHWDFKGANGTADTSSNTQTRSYPAGSGPFTVTVTATTSAGRQATGSTVITP